MIKESIKEGLDNYPIKTNGWSHIFDSFMVMNQNPNQKELEAALLLAESDLIKQVRFEWIWVELDQYKKVDHLKLEDEPGLKVTANAKTIITISRERLCSKTSLEMRINWQCLLGFIAKIDPVLVTACVPECIYRGFCPKINPCQYTQTSVFKTQLEFYRNLPKYV